MYWNSLGRRSQFPVTCLLRSRIFAGLNPADGESPAKHAYWTEFGCFIKLIATASAGASDLPSHGPLVSFSILLPFRLRRLKQRLFSWSILKQLLDGPERPSESFLARNELVDSPSVLFFAG